MTGLVSPLFPAGGVCLRPPVWGVALRLLSPVLLPPTPLLRAEAVFREDVGPRDATLALPGLESGEVTLEGGETPLPRTLLELLMLVGEVMVPLPPVVVLEAVLSVGVFLLLAWVSKGTLLEGNRTLSGGKTGLPGRYAGAVLLEGAVCTLAAVAAVVVVGEEAGGEKVEGVVVVAVEAGHETLTGGRDVSLLCKKLDLGTAIWVSFLLAARLVAAAASPAAAPAARTAASEAASVLGVVVVVVVTGTVLCVVMVGTVLGEGVVGEVVLFSFDLCEVVDAFTAAPGWGVVEAAADILDLVVFTYLRTPRGSGWEAVFFTLEVEAEGEEGLAGDALSCFVALVVLPFPQGSDVLLLMLPLPPLVLMADRFPSLVMEGSVGLLLEGLLPLASSLALRKPLFLRFLARALTKSASRQESSVTISDSNPPSSELPVLVLCPPEPLGGLTETEALLAEEVSSSSVFVPVFGGSSTKLV